MRRLLEWGYMCVSVWTRLRLAREHLVVEPEDFPMGQRSRKAISWESFACVNSSEITEHLTVMMMMIYP
jgi:hypothetical protein